MRSRVASGSGSPKRSTAPSPAAASIQVMAAPAASTTRRVAAATSGPMPSPGIRTIGVAKMRSSGRGKRRMMSASGRGSSRGLDAFREYEGRGKFPRRILQDRVGRQDHRRARAVRSAGEKPTPRAPATFPGAIRRRLRWQAYEDGDAVSVAWWSGNRRRTCPTLAGTECQIGPVRRATRRMDCRLAPSRCLRGRGKHDPASIRHT